MLSRCIYIFCKGVPSNTRALQEWHSLTKDTDICIYIYMFIYIYIYIYITLVGLFRAFQHKSPTRMALLYKRYIYIWKAYIYVREFIYTYIQEATLQEWPSFTKDTDICIYIYMYIYIYIYICACIYIYVYMYVMYTYVIYTYVYI